MIDKLARDRDNVFPREFLPYPAVTRVDSTDESELVASAIRDDEP